MDLSREQRGKSAAFSASERVRFRLRLATVKEVTDGALLMEKDGGAEAINLDFVLRIREHPTNKKGKKKSVVLD